MDNISIYFTTQRLFVSLETNLTKSPQNNSHTTVSWTLWVSQLAWSLAHTLVAHHTTIQITIQST